MKTAATGSLLLGAKRNNVGYWLQALRIWPWYQLQKHYVKNSVQQTTTKLSTRVQATGKELFRMLRTVQLLHRHHLHLHQRLISCNNRRRLTLFKETNQQKILPMSSTRMRSSPYQHRKGPPKKEVLGKRRKLKLHKRRSRRKIRTPKDWSRTSAYQRRSDNQNFVRKRLQITTNNFYQWLIKSFSINVLSMFIKV